MPLTCQNKLPEESPYNLNYLFVERGRPSEVRDGSIDAPTQVLKNHDGCVELCCSISIPNTASAGMSCDVDLG